MEGRKGVRTEVRVEASGYDAQRGEALSFYSSCEVKQSTRGWISAKGTRDFDLISENCAEVSTSPLDGNGLF